MFLNLLLVTTTLAAVTSLLVAWIFNRPIGKILNRVVSDELGATWKKYILFAIVVVGVSGGVRLWDLERYITPKKDEAPLVLNSDRWTLEIFRTVFGSLQSIAWMLLVFFLFALLAYVVVRGFEMKRAPSGDAPKPQ